jgi:mercuric ion binding protein
MNRITTLMLLLVISSFTLVNANAGDEVNHQATFNVEKMTCATCPITVRKAIQGVDGVKEVTVDYDSKTATVIYDSSLTDTKLIANSCSNVGFPAILIEENVL